MLKAVSIDMLKDKTFLAIIPARGGSKGIPHKNIYPIRGIPLISYTLQESKKSKYLDRIIVSTDDDSIADVTRSESVGVVMRPPELARDDSKTIDAILHVIASIDDTYDYLVLLQPTSPLRKLSHIDEAIELFLDSGCVPLASVSRVQNHPILIRSLNDEGKLVNLLNQISTVRRQDMPDYYYVNGAIFIHSIADLSEDTSLNDNRLGYIMPPEYGLDVDEPFDIKRLEMMLDYLGRK